MKEDILKLVKNRYFGMKYETTSDCDYLLSSHDSYQSTCDIITCILANIILCIYLFNYRYYNAVGFVVHYSVMFALIKMASKVLFSPRTIYQLFLYAVTDVIIISLSIIPVLVFSWVIL